MTMKKVLCEVLKKSVEKVSNTSAASWLTFGVEEMPESMKKQR